MDSVSASVVIPLFDPCHSNVNPSKRDLAQTKSIDVSVVEKLKSSVFPVSLSLVAIKVRIPESMVLPVILQS